MNEKTEAALAGALKIIEDLLAGKGVKEANEFLKGMKDGTFPKPSRFRLAVEQSDHTLPGFGAYEAGSAKPDLPERIPTGRVLLNLDVIFWACAATEGMRWSEIAAESASHELFHALQDFLERNLEEWNIEGAIQKVRESGQAPDPESFPDPPWFIQIENRMGEASSGAVVLFVDKTAPDQAFVLEKTDQGPDAPPDWSIADLDGVEVSIGKGSSGPELRTFTIHRRQEETDEDEA